MIQSLLWGIQIANRKNTSDNVLQVLVIVILPQVW